MARKSGDNACKFIIALTCTFSFSAHAGISFVQRLAIPDPHAGKVVLLLHGEEANGSTNFVDSSGKGHTFRVYGSPAVSTAEKKVGNGSLFNNGTATQDTNKLMSNFSGHLRFAGDFTVEAWAYLISKPDTYSSFISRGTTDNGDGGFEIGVDASNWRFTLYEGGWKTAVGSAFSYNTWTHLAVDRQGSTIRLYINGVVQTATLTSTVPVWGKGHIDLFVGNPATDNNDWHGYIDEVRVTNGVARYAGADFAPPTTAFWNPPKPTCGNGTEVVTVLTAGTTSYTVPPDWCNLKNAIECIGGGGGGNKPGKTGGGGGAYSRSLNLEFTPGTSLTVQIGAGGGAGAAGGVSSIANGGTTLVSANGGSGGASMGGGAGGTVVAAGWGPNLGHYLSQGGAGGSGGATGGSGGGGGAGGAYFRGWSGYTGSQATGGGGGGHGWGTSAPSVNGGDNRHRNGGGGIGGAAPTSGVDGGGGGGGNSGVAGASGSAGDDIAASPKVGSGGGGGGGGSGVAGSGGNGGLYGGGGGGSKDGTAGSGGAGVCVIRYTP